MGLSLRSSGSGLSKKCKGVIEADLEEMATGPGELHALLKIRYYGNTPKGAQSHVYM